ncbi:MAG: carbonic anhydrase [Gammaproteobacteria bacterium]|jgi:carbonic anhydrase
MDKVIKGIAKFKEKGFEERRELFKTLATGQSPEVLFITCSDSRIDPNLITHTEPGDLFIIRNAGNIVPPHVKEAGGNTATIEYGVQVLGVEDIIICGHTDCGAMKGAMNPDSVKTLPHVSEWLQHSAAASARCEARHGQLGAEHTLEMIQENVLLQMSHLQTHPSVAAKLAVNEIAVHGWVYDIENGEVTAYDDAQGKFIPVEEKYLKSS